MFIYLNLKFESGNLCIDLRKIYFCPSLFILMINELCTSNFGFHAQKQAWHGAEDRGVNTH